MLRYRRNVAFILSRPGGKILVCERADFCGSWQFPQGGVRDGENDLEALHREVREEISLSPEDYRVILQRGPYRYCFRQGFKKEGCDGQEQIYFLAEVVDEKNTRVQVDQNEFQSFRWIKPSSFKISWVPPIKRDVYRAVFRDFFKVFLK